MKKQSREVLFLFTLLVLTRVVEYFIIRTDLTAVGENILHKITGIIILVITLRVLKLGLNTIGFNKALLKGVLLGTSIFIATYFIAYLVEVLIVAASGSDFRIEFYMNSFSLTGEGVKSSATGIIIFALLSNLINSVMEEGVFRGLFFNRFKKSHGLKVSNLLQALLFGLWHIIMPLRALLDGDYTITQFAISSLTYILLSLFYGYKLGLLAIYSGSLWAGIAEHTLNNSVINLLHITTDSGADLYQSLRVVVAQVVSFVLILIYGKIVSKVK